MCIGVRVYRRKGSSRKRGILGKENSDSHETSRVLMAKEGIVRTGPDEDGIGYHLFETENLCIKLEIFSCFFGLCIPIHSLVI